MKDSSSADIDFTRYPGFYLGQLSHPREEKLNDSYLQQSWLSWVSQENATWDLVAITQAHSLYRCSVSDTHLLV